MWLNGSPKSDERVGSSAMRNPDQMGEAPVKYELTGAS